MIALSLKLNWLIFNFLWQKPKETAAETQTRSILRKNIKKHFPLIFFCVVKFQFHINRIWKFELCVFNTFSDINV